MPASCVNSSVPSMWQWKDVRPVGFFDRRTAVGIRSLRQSTPSVLTTRPTANPRSQWCSPMGFPVAWRSIGKNRWTTSLKNIRVRTATIPTQKSTATSTSPCTFFRQQNDVYDISSPFTCARLFQLNTRSLKRDILKIFFQLNFWTWTHYFSDYAPILWHSWSANGACDTSPKSRSDVSAIGHWTSDAVTPFELSGARLNPGRGAQK